jgi:DNA mismatch endonuclease (patch repair protein)
MDTVSPEKRREIMRAIRGKDTHPELMVRSLAHGLGYRYRLHRKDLPGSPDLVFVSPKKVVFVHGCFWHGHECRADRHPKTRPDYWAMRIAKNQERDLRKQRELQQTGWSVLTIWECELRDPAAVVRRLRTFLDVGKLRRPKHRSLARTTIPASRLGGPSTDNSRSRLRRSG